MSRATLYCGDAHEVLRDLPDESVQCCVTSPPYWGLRDYGTATWQGGSAECDHRQERGSTRGGPRSTITGGQDTQPHAAQYAHVCPCGAQRIDAQLGLEPTPDAYVANLVKLFRGVRRVLRDDGTLWLNLGDSYGSRGGDTFSGFNSRWDGTGLDGGKQAQTAGAFPQGQITTGLKPKDLVGIPWRVAFALQADGWWLRSDIIWAKPNPMPESVTDRPTKAHEYVFLLAKSERYYYDAAAVSEPTSWAETDPRQHDAEYEAPRTDRGYPGSPSKSCGILKARRVDGMIRRNARTVWEISTQPYPQAHFATFPEELARRCIVAGSSPKACESCGAPWERDVERDSKPPGRSTGDVYTAMAYVSPQSAVWGKKRNLGGDPRPQWDGGWQPTCACENTGTARCTVLDPFGGSGTVAQVATGNGRDAIYIDLNPKYVELAQQRIGPMFCDAPDTERTP